MSIYWQFKADYAPLSKESEWQLSLWNRAQEIWQLVVPNYVWIDCSTAKNMAPKDQ